MNRQGMLPVWFFIGALLFIYGVIILGASLRDWSRTSTLLLAAYHPGVWGGIVLLILGGLYVIRFWPRKE
jgi:hypothetical protein